MTSSARVEVADRVHLSLAGEEETAVAFRIVMPKPGNLPDNPIVFFTHPGGAMRGDYYDLGEGPDRPFSFAQAMADRGAITVLVDPPGIGASAAIADGYQITPDLLVRAHAGVVARASALLAKGAGGHPAIVPGLCIGIGHSMGASPVVIQQARGQTFDAVIVMGSGPYGLPQHLPEPLHEFLDIPGEAYSRLADVMREKGVPPVTEMRPGRTARELIGRGPEASRAAIRAVRAPILSVMGYFVMIPRSWAAEAAQVEVPVLLVFGDNDICADPGKVPAWYPRSRDVQLEVLPQTGHNHFAHDTFPYLAERIATWAASLHRMR